MSEILDNNEKNKVAFASVLVACGLVVFKLIVGIATGSLGILSEALHSALDSVSAFITWIAVRLSDKPADNEHNFGHGKIENFSALIESILLLITCGWIICEAIDRLTSKHTEIKVGFWSFAVVITSIFVDIGRARILKKTAIKFKSQALEADALHFATDIWSSTVVLIGIICAYFEIYSADAIAALCVALIAIWVSLKLSMRAIDQLLDKAPDGMREKVSDLIGSVEGVILSHDLRVRCSGCIYVIDVNIHVSPTLTIVQAHEISERIEKLLRANIGESIINVHIEPA
jgi:cation diffusion facilitator family transporter